MKPYLIDQLQNIVIKKGNIIKFDIKYGGEPAPAVTWSKDGEELVNKGDKCVSPSSFIYNNYLLNGWGENHVRVDC